MPVQLRFASRAAWPDVPATPALYVAARDPSQAGRTALLAIDEGTGGFTPRGPEGVPVEVWVDNTGALDDVFAAWLLTAGADRIAEPGARVLAEYAASCRKGYSPDQTRLEVRPRCIFEEMKRDLWRAPGKAEGLARLWGELDAFFRHLLDQLAGGRNLLTDDLFSGQLRFREYVEMLQRDYVVYLEDRAQGRVLSWQPGWERVPAPLLVIENPRASRFADWAREDEEAPGNHGFTYLLTRYTADDAAHWVLSTDPRARRSVAEMAEPLQALEAQAREVAGAGGDSSDPWVSVAHLNGTLVGSPRGGSRLVLDDVLGAFRSHGRLRKVRLDSDGAATEGAPRRGHVAARWGAGFALVAAAAVAVAVLTTRHEESSIPAPECTTRRGEGGPKPSRAELIGKGMYRALLIGIDDYSHNADWGSLRTPVSDVRQLQALLTDRYGFDRRNVKVLTNDQATAANVTAALKSLIKVEPEDLVFVYYGGHGAREEHDKQTILGCWVLHDSRNKPDSCVHGYPASNVRDHLSKSQAKHVFLAVDSCFSGAIGTRGGAKNDTASTRCKLARPSNLFLAAGSDSTMVNDEDHSGRSSPFARAIVDELRHSDGPVSLTRLRQEIERNYEGQVAYRTVVDSLRTGEHLAEHEFVFLPGDRQANNSESGAGATPDRPESASSRKAGNGDRASSDQTNRARRALLIAVARYPPGSGFDEPLASLRDLQLMRGALRKRGFDDVVALTEEEAGAAHIRKAWNKLIDRTRPGDVVAIHYSGHGVTLEDQNGDEIDGVDEALAPYGAHRNVTHGSEGEYIRDDEVNAYLRRLRRKAGPAGHVLATFDSCYSGTVTRGGGGGATRGGRGAPRKTHSGPDLDRGGMDAHRRGEDGQLASYVAISAAASDQPSREARIGQQQVGSLVWALTSSLARLNGTETYGQLYDDIRVCMQRSVPGQSPQVEGDLGTRVLDGAAIAQTPYVRVLGWDDGVLQLDAGLPAGLTTGAVVSLHPKGTRHPTDATRIAQAVVERADWLHSWAKPVGVAARALGEMWAFIAERAFGTFTLKVTAGLGVRPDEAERLQSSLERTPVLEWVAGRAASLADVVVSKKADDGAWHLTERDAATSATRPREWSDMQGLVLGLRARARAHFLRSLELEGDDVRIRAGLIACDPADPTRRGEPLIVDPRTGAHQLAAGSGYRIQLLNPSFSNRLLVSVVRIDADDNIVSLLPAAQHGQEGAMPTKEWLHPPLSRPCLRLPADSATTTLKVFATRERLLDFRPLERGVATQTRGSVDELVRVALTLPRTRGEAVAASRPRSLAVPRGHSTSLVLRAATPPD